MILQGLYGTCGVSRIEYCKWSIVDPFHGLIIDLRTVSRSLNWEIRGYCYETTVIRAFQWNRVSRAVGEVNHNNYGWNRNYFSKFRINKGRPYLAKSTALKGTCRVTFTKTIFQLIKKNRAS